MVNIWKNIHKNDSFWKKFKDNREYCDFSYTEHYKNYTIIYESKKKTYTFISNITKQKMVFKKSRALKQYLISLNN